MIETPPTTDHLSFLPSPHLTGAKCREWMGMGVAAGIIIISDYGSFPKIPCVKRTSTLWWTNIAMENHHFSWENPLSMAIFHSFLYVHQRVYHHKIPLNPIKPPFSYGFPMVYQRVFSSSHHLRWDPHWVQLDTEVFRLLELAGARLRGDREIGPGCSCERP